MSNLTLILLTKNEQRNLKNWTWLNKLEKLNEIIVVDDGSTDDTKKIIKSFSTKIINIKIFDRGLDNDYATQRNFAVSKATNNWIFFIDADEIPSPKLINYLNNLNLNNNVCYSINRYMVYQDQILYHGVSAADKSIRLFNKNSGKFVNPVHEIWSTNNMINNIKAPIFHNSAPNLKSLLNKLNIYSTIRAQELYQNHIKVNLIDIIIYPKAKFIQYYFWHMGIIDGIPGLIIALALSFYSFLVRSKLWRLYHT